MKTRFKSVSRMFRSNVMRMIAISFIVAIGISILTGICGLPERIRAADINSTDIIQIATVKALGDKLELLGYIFPAFFIFVTVLTVLTTITRLAEEERSQIACLKTLGYSNAAIISKYIIFTLVCVTIGCSLGVIIGNYVLSPLIFESVAARYDLNASGSLYIKQGVLWSAVMSAAVIITAVIVSVRRCRGKPAMLLRAKAPKAGSKIMLEYIPFIWKPMKFKYKSSVRNIFRYKSRLLMTVVSVIGCTAIMFCGIGLFGSLDSMRGNTDTYSNAEGFIESMIPVSAAVILFGAALSVLVLFNLTNINIEERRREIATLKVLGYSQIEVADYIYREIMLISAAGIVIGVPLGYGLLGFLFNFIDFGSLSYVKWYIWLITAASSFLSVLTTNFLLYWKIKRINMTSSLKTVD